MKNKLKGIPILVSSLIFNFLGAFIVSKICGDVAPLYDSLKKPSFAPPNMVFPIAWGILYVLISVAVFLDYRKGGNNLIVYIISMLFNFSWSIVFFKERLYGIAFFIILILIVISIYLGIKYLKNSKIASIFMVIYILWLTYAGALNYFIWMYNEM